MFEEFCLECGHLLVKNRTLCKFCGWMEKLPLFKDKLFDSDKEDDLNQKFIRKDKFREYYLTAL
jgi:hypothetical protein